MSNDTSFLVKALLQEAKNNEVHLYVKEGKLAFVAEQGSLDASLKEKIKNSKQDIIDYLSSLQDENHGNNQTVVQQDTLRRVSRDQPLPLSFAQQRLWFIDQLQQGKGTEYITTEIIEVNGDFSVAIAQGALQRIVARHESLRTLFDMDGDEAVQVINQHTEFTIKSFDLAALNPMQRQAQLDAIIHKYTDTPFDLQRDLMIRVASIRLAESDSILIFQMHHIASDGWSMAVLLNEFSVQYQAVSEQGPDPLPALPFQYADYAWWQRNELSQASYNEQLSYWQAHLADMPMVHSLSLDMPRENMRWDAGAVLRGTLEKTCSEALFTLATKYQLTPYMVLHGALALVLSAHSHSHDIVIGTPVANRNLPEIAPLIGCFVNTLVLRTNTQFVQLEDYLRHVRDVNLSAQANQDVPFENLVEVLSCPRDNHLSPLFQIMFTMDTNQRGDAMSLPGVALAPYGEQKTVAKFDLDISARVTEDGLFINWTYNSSLFTEVHIQQLNQHLLNLLTSMADSFEQPMSALSMLSQQERHVLLQERTDIHPQLVAPGNIPQQFEQAVAQYPEKTALVHKGQSLSYQGLNNRANQLAHYLLETQQLESGTLVGLCLYPSSEMIIAILAILKAGGAYVPVDPSYPLDRTQHIVEEAGLSVVLTQQSCVAPFRDTSVSPVMMDNLASELKPGHFLTAYPTHSLNHVSARLNESSLAYVLYTSGSTGKPKGVLQTQNNLCRFFASTKGDFAYGENDTWCLSHANTFDVSVWEMFAALLFGGKLLIPSQDEVKDPQLMLRMYQEQQLTVLNKTPSVFKQLTEVMKELDVSLPHLKKVILAGEELTSLHLEAWRRIRGNSETQLFNAYGPTESTIVVTYSRIDDIQNITIGKATKDQGILLLDEHMRLVPDGALGEAHVVGAGIAKGYLNQPELTEQRFVDNPYCDLMTLSTREAQNKTLYKTGDLMRYSANGQLEYHGRIDNQVKIRGFRIELGEIESVLNSVDAVNIAVVKPHDSDALGKVLMAYLTLAGNEQSDAELIDAIKRVVKSKLPQYMWPAHYEVVSTIGVLSSGKLDRNALPAPRFNHYLQDSFKAPSNEVETQLMAIWKGLLEVTEFGVNSDFFEIGGHSLLLAPLVNRVRDGFQVEISVRQVFDNPTIEMLAQLVGDLLPDDEELVDEAFVDGEFDEGEF